jgi:hypothetical protein
MPKFELFCICYKGERAISLRETKTYGSPFIWNDLPSPYPNNRDNKVRHLMLSSIMNDAHDILHYWSVYVRHHISFCNYHEWQLCIFDVVDHVYSCSTQRYKNIDNIGQMDIFIKSCSCQFFAKNSRREL